MSTINGSKEWTAGEWAVLQRDERYWALWQTCVNKKTVVDAGFIREPEELRSSAQTLPDLPPGQILLLTGCFAPIHDGHLNAMRQAKEAIEGALEKPVVAGFFGFCHDRYVEKKTKEYPIERRLRLFEAVRESWMHALNWESEQEFQTNFTSVWAVLQSQYPKHSVSLVFGSDNAAFSRVFRTGETHVCVSRKAKTSAEVASPARLIQVEGAHPSMSSTRMRERA